MTTADACQRWLAAQWLLSCGLHGNEHENRSSLSEAKAVGLRTRSSWPLEFRGNRTRCWACGVRGLCCNLFKTVALSCGCTFESGFSYVDKLKKAHVSSTVQKSPVTVIATSIKRKKVILPALVVHACSLYFCDKARRSRVQDQPGLWQHPISRNRNQLSSPDYNIASTKWS